MYRDSTNMEHGSNSQQTVQTFRYMFLHKGLRSKRRWPSESMCVLPDQDRPNTDLDGTQIMTCDYIKGTKGHYMPRESFLHLRKYERMIEKITVPTPVHLLDHIIIPINIRKSHWFPAHINVQTRSINLSDSSQAYSAAAYPQQKMLMWKMM